MVEWSGARSGAVGGPGCRHWRAVDGAADDASELDQNDDVDPGDCLVTPEFTRLPLLS